jgi:hypothetical protein
MCTVLHWKQWQVQCVAVRYAHACCTGNTHRPPDAGRFVDKRSEPLPAFLASLVRISTVGGPGLKLCDNDGDIPCMGAVEDNACSEIMFYGPSEHCQTPTCAIHHYDMYAVPRVCKFAAYVVSDVSGDTAASGQATDCVDKGTCLSCVCRDKACTKICFNPCGAGLCFRCLRAIFGGGCSWRPMWNNGHCQLTLFLSMTHVRDLLRKDSDLLKGQGLVGRTTPYKAVFWEDIKAWRAVLIFDQSTENANHCTFAPTGHCLHASRSERRSPTTVLLGVPG